MRVESALAEFVAVMVVVASSAMDDLRTPSELRLSVRVLEPVSVEFNIPLK